ncbi:LytR/AlgR family response regulator transcription factor [Arsenicibacter rosenii]|uniref:DNA-binding response regulator n=1 Tax=Arsenicibacter rosenii TaxID=1750698 RepID=A0A1S2VHL8_9BACT|nr:LytTR family DNA-binding domain-containing protein [Arsenicibacter rosenii]OIN58244.1 DNA-binding response regulator [Arsenicibacter rosenii]
MNAILIEDEKLVAKEFAFKIAEIDADICIVETLPSVKTALRWFGENAEPDVVFADIQLADGVSFEIFEKFTLNCPIIFVTSYNEYAIQAFKVNGIDYLLKPVDPDDLEKAIAKARSIHKQKAGLSVDLQKLMQALQHPGAAAKAVYKENFLGNSRSGWVPVKTADIAFFQYELVNFMVTKANERYTLDYETMEQIEELLDPAQFYRANRQFIVNIDAIQSVKSLENAKLVLRLRSPHQAVDVDISRQKAPAFKRWLDR